MNTYLNESGVPLSVAVYLATDHYDYIPNTVSATALMKPIRQQVLGYRIPAGQKQEDVTNLVKSRMGTSIHDGIERAWNGHYKEAMTKLGYPQKIIDRIVVNPEGPLASDAIPVYMEKRSFREIAGVTVSGKFDFVAEGRVEDFKSTSTYTWTKGVKDDDYQLQGSIYRWLNPDIITQDVIAVQFFFTDWKAYEAAKNPDYPQRSVECKLIPLLSLEETEAWITKRLTSFDHHKNGDEKTLPLCTDKELWRKDDVWKVYKDPNNLKRAMNGGSHTSAGAANVFLQEKTGGRGVVVKIPGQVMACKYCQAFPICTQKDDLIANGSLIFT
jgi:hypothetical protein